MSAGMIGNNTRNAANVTNQSPTIDEIALYDRQIRLWGVKAQEKYALSSNMSEKSPQF